MALTVSVISRQQRQGLPAAASGNDPIMVPAEYLTFEIEGDTLPETVDLDDRTIPVIHNEARTRGYFIFDAFRSVGFHCLRAAGEDFWFGTEDAKLKMDGILAMLIFLEHEGLSWGSQLFFSDGTAIRHHKIDYAWLSRNAQKVLELARAIADAPIRRPSVVQSHGIPKSGRLLVRETISLLRRNPQVFLEENPSGSVAVGERHFVPRAVVVGRSRPSFNTPANRRMTQLLMGSRELAWSLMQEPSLPRPARHYVEQFCQNVDAALGLFPFSALKNVPTRVTDRASPEEMVDERYRRAFELHGELMRDLGWDPTIRIAHRFAYVGYADQIYQAFVAIVLARAFGAQQLQPSLMPRLSTPVFRSEQYDLYYDTTPPRSEFLNWRDESSRPADMRPDITIVDRDHHRGILVDAKYQMKPSGRLPPEALEECQVYMQSFGRRSIVVCYPGKVAQVTEVCGSGYTILEVSIAPFENLIAYAANEIRPRVERLMG